ncbi:MAG TPA: sigma-70 family RNA polymerase sigma factor [Acidimicrobiales bacterium]|nr:sigma-70 family RNA polymerase sigma factor [Acidimicrobiales bacterium]
MSDDEGRSPMTIDVVWREQRPLMVDLAFRMLGDIGGAEDVVQDAFSRLLRVDLDTIDDVRAWLVVVVSRRCLDELRSARSRRQELGLDPDAAALPPTADPADRVTLDDDVRMALLVVLQRLSPAERTVFVLHDVFRFSFEMAASIVGRSPEACRKLASRARRRIADESAPARFVAAPDDPLRVAERFIAACAGGDIAALMALLDPDVVGEVDLGDGREWPLQVGRDQVARNLLRYFAGDGGTILVSHPVNGQLGLLAYRRGALVAIVTLATKGGLIDDIHAVADPTGFLAPDQ